MKDDSFIEGPGEVKRDIETQRGGGRDKGSQKSELCTLHKMNSGGHS